MLVVSHWHTVLCWAGWSHDDSNLLQRLAWCYAAWRWMSRWWLLVAWSRRVGFGAVGSRPGGSADETRGTKCR